MLEGTVFTVATLALAYVSSASLLKLRSHGFYRFIAWELMLAMFTLNMSSWFEDINSTHQLVAGTLFFISLLLVLAGFSLLQLSGNPDANRNDTPLLDIEKTTSLVTHGVYRYIRHPIYASLIFLCWGFFFKQPSPVEGALGIIATAFLIAAARAEEGENISYFGEDYREYMKRSKMFLPFIL